jgi:CHAT domain-containing protein/tetratricopeptide (TPR) repeat protein
MSGDFRKHAAEAFRQMEEGAPHPAMEEIAAHLSGRLEARRSEAVEAHLSGCANCRERASEFELFLAHRRQPGTQPSEEIEEEYRRVQRRLRAGKVVRLPRYWLPIAAGILVAIGVAGAAWRWLVPTTPQLLAEAYHEHGASEFRLAGAAHSELRQERAGGSAFSQPASLLKAQARIQEDLKSRGSDPGLLRLEGEAQIIAGEAAEAVKTLKLARDLRSNDPKILASLGVACAMLGDEEHDFDDYKQADDFLGHAERLSSHDLEVKFNRAVVVEKLMMYDGAEIAWQEYLKADSASDWAKEARARLAAVQQKLREREKKLGDIRDDPAHFVQLADAGDIDAEGWLISPVSAAWLARSPSDPAARQAAARLAGILASKHGDTWLRDMTAASCTSADAGAALGRLAAADASANAGQYESALAAAREIAAALARTGCSPGAAQARLLQIAALENLGNHQECLSLAGQFGRELESRPYVRLRARVAKEDALCAMRSGLLDRAGATVEQALRLAEKAGYGATRLDLWNIGLDKTTYSGLPSQIIAGAAESLRMFWSGAYPRSLAYLPFYELRLYAARSDQKNAAVDFARSAVWAMQGADAVTKIQVGAYANLAVAERELGDLSAAAADLTTSNEVAQRVPVRYRVGPAAALARIDLERGDADAALNRLAPLQSVAFGMSWVARAGYYTTLGETLTRKGSLDDAAAAFRKVIDSAARYLDSVRSDDERSGVLKGVEGAYRGLVDAQLAAPGNEALALRTWQSRRDLDASGATSSGTPQEPCLWFLELPDSFVAWSSAGNSPVFQKLAAPKADIVAVARRFLQESSNPLSAPESLRADARQLYDWMIGPFEPVLGAARSLIFELDGALTALPVQSLVARDGRYLCDRVSVLISCGRSARPVSDSASNANVLVIANPAIAGRSAVHFPPLADSLREADAIRASFVNSQVLEGRAASIDSLTRELPRADIVHFAGHGYGGSGFGALLFAPKDPATADFQLLRAGDMRGMDWSRCRLAVLSACASAEGETHGAHNPDSLIRALARAGVSRVAASLWNVDSTASAELMKQFYSGLKNGRSPAVALRAAQQTVRLNPRWRQPYYWAGFQLYGTT